MCMDWNAASSLGRRSFVKKAAMAGVSASSLRWGTQEGLAKAADDDEVPYVKFLHGTPEPHGSGRKPIYDSIPREEWERRWTAVNLRDRVGQKLKRKYDESLLSPEFTSMDSSPTGFGVKVVYTTVEENGEEVRSPNVPFSEVQLAFEGTGKGAAAKGDFRASREGIPITVTRRTQRDLGCSESDLMDTTALDAVPAGVDSHAVNEGYGSLCASFSRSDYGAGYIVSGHVVGGEFGGASGTEVEQGGEKIGEVRDSQVNADIDWAYVEDSVSGKYPAEKVADASDITTNDYDIGGIVTDDTLINKAGTSESFYTQGKATKRITGTLINVGGTGSTYVTSSQDLSLIHI